MNATDRPVTIRDTAWRPPSGGSPLEGITLGEALTRAGDGACVSDPESRIVLWNTAAERILGYTAREVAGHPCGGVFKGRGVDGNRMCFLSCAVQGLAALGETIQSFDMLSETKAGQPVWLNVSVLPVANRRGTGSYIVHLFRDLTAAQELVAPTRERLAALSTTEEAAPEAEGTLTRREREVLHLLTTGANTRTAAEKLGVSRATVRNHVQNILGKLGVHSRLEAVAYANRHRLL